MQVFSDSVQIYAPTDNTIAAGMATVTMVANDNGLPTICGEEGMVDATVPSALLLAASFS